MKYYLHTIDGKPAFFDGEQISFARLGSGGKRPQPLAADLAQIKREQHASNRWRTKQDFDLFEYGYVVVTVPEIP